MLKQLKKYLESKKKERVIFDIILFGSAVKGKIFPKDIDIVVIFLEGSLRERLDKVQQIKDKLKTLNKNFDIKQITLKELFSSHFLARTGVLLEGLSLFTGKKFCELLGFQSHTLFWYNLNGMSHTQKVKFNYILAGRKYMEGVIKEFNGERLSRGVIKIPIENSLEFEEILKNNKVNYRKKDILETS